MFNRWLTLPQENFLLLGPRRAGKTTLLKQVLPTYRYVTLDDFDYLTWANEDPKGFVAQLGRQAIIDEIQRAPQLTIAVKHVIDERQATVVMTGSSSLGLLDSSADTLAGRIDIVHLPTTCWGEIEGAPRHHLFDEQASREDVLSGKRGFEDAMMFGGFPEVVATPDHDARISLLKRYRDTYFTRDLAQLSNIEHIEGLLAILNHVGRSIGSHLEVSNFARESGLSHPTAKKYLNVLTQSELAFRLYGYQHGPAKRYVKAAKLYFADNGLLTALGQSVSRGQLVENFVISELEKRRKLGWIAADQFYYYKSVGGLEVDLIFEEKRTLTAIEIKATNKITPRDLSNLRMFKEQHKGRRVRAVLFYLGTHYLTQDGIDCIPVAALWRAQI